MEVVKNKQIATNILRNCCITVRNNLCLDVVRKCWVMWESGTTGRKIKKRLNKEIVSGEKKLGVQAVEGPQVQSKNQ